MLKGVTMKLRQVKRIIKVEEILEDGRPALEICWRVKRCRSNETVIIPSNEYILLKNYFLEPYKEIYSSLSRQVEELKKYNEGVKNE